MNGVGVTAKKNLNRKISSKVHNCLRKQNGNKINLFNLLYFGLNNLQLLYGALFTIHSVKSFTFFLQDNSKSLHIMFINLPLILINLMLLTKFFFPQCIKTAANN